MSTPRWLRSTIWKEEVSLWVRASFYGLRNPCCDKMGRTITWPARWWERSAKSPRHIASVGTLFCRWLCLEVTRWNLICANPQIVPLQKLSFDGFLSLHNASFLSSNCQTWAVGFFDWGVRFIALCKKSSLSFPAKKSLCGLAYAGSWPIFPRSGVSLQILTKDPRKGNEIRKETRNIFQGNCLASRIATQKRGCISLADWLTHTELDTRLAPLAKLTQHTNFITANFRFPLQLGCFLKCFGKKAKDRS